MTTPGRLVVLPLLLLAGCWPYLGGPFEDYIEGEGTGDPDSDPDGDTRDPDTEGTDDRDTDDPDTQGPGGGPVIAGWIEQAEYMGVGWSNPDLLQISAILGGIGGNDTFRYTDGLPSSGGCVTTWSRGQNLLGVLAPVGLSSVQITLPPNGAFGTQPASDEPNALVGGIDASGIASGNASVTISGNAEAGTLDGTLTRTPSAFSVDAPDLDGDVLPTVPFGDFDVEYSGTLSDAVVVSVIYVSNDNESLGGHDCLGRNGSVTSSPSSLGVSAEDLQYAQVIVSRVRETSGSLSGSANAESEVVGVTAQVGIVLFEEPAAP